MRHASIDIGTNSVLLLVVEQRAEGHLEPVEERCEITRLGQGVDADRELQDEAMVRTLVAIAAFAARARDLGAEGIEIVGTSALRDARNGSRFIEQVQERVGEMVTIISGQREAGLILAGVQTSFGKLPQGSLIFDVGGGSTEFIAVNEEGGVAALQSLDMGAVRLTERFIAQDPPAREELRGVRDSVRTALAGLPTALMAEYGEAPSPLLVGVSGTITTLYAIENRLPRYDASQVDGSSLSLAQVEGLATRLASLTLDERRALRGLEPRRADVIVAGALIVGEVMRFVDAREMRLADRGVRWGLLAHRG